MVSSTGALAFTGATSVGGTLTAARLALVSYARHVFTDYDELLADGYDRDSARHFVLDDLNAALAAWGAAPVPEDEPGEPEADPR